MEFYYKNREHFGDDEYHRVPSAEAMNNYAQQDNNEVETVYFHYAEIVRLDRIEENRMYFSLREYN